MQAERISGERMRLAPSGENGLAHAKRKRSPEV
jgi:hypothetical protein